MHMFIKTFGVSSQALNRSNWVDHMLSDPTDVQALDRAVLVPHGELLKCFVPMVHALPCIHQPCATSAWTCCMSLPFSSQFNGVKPAYVLEDDWANMWTTCSVCG